MASQQGIAAVLPVLGGPRCIHSTMGEPSLAILTEFLGLCKFDLRGKITGSKVVDHNHFL